MSEDKDRIETKIKLAKLKKKRDDMLDELKDLQTSEKHIADFWRRYSCLSYRIECIEKHLAPKPPGRPTGKDTAHDFVFKYRINGNEV